MKQDREALCSRLEKTEKRVAFLTKKLNENAAVIVAAKQAAEASAAIKQLSSQPSSTLPSTENSSSLDSSTFSNYFTDSTLFGKLANDLPESVSKPASSIGTLAPTDIPDFEPLSTPIEKLKKRSRKPADKNQSPTKRVKSISADSDNSNALQSHNEKVNSINGTKDISNCVSKESKKALVSKRRRTVTSNTSSGHKSFIDDEVEIDNVPPLKASAIPKEIFTTNSPYEVVSVREISSQINAAASMIDCDISDALPSGVCDEVEVPSFRVMTFSNNYSLEGTEVTCNYCPV